MRKTVYLTILLAILLVQQFAAARSVLAEQMLGNPTEGLKFARELCVECHQVEPGEAARAFPAEKSFLDIAADPKMTALSLRVFLRTPHIEMPDFVLTEAQTDDVIAYILSLK